MMHIPISEQQLWRPGNSIEWQLVFDGPETQFNEVRGPRDHQGLDKEDGDRTAIPS